MGVKWHSRCGFGINDCNGGSGCTRLSMTLIPVVGAHRRAYMCMCSAWSHLGLEMIVRQRSQCFVLQQVHNLFLDTVIQAHKSLSPTFTFQQTPITNERLRPQTWLRRGTWCALAILVGLCGDRMGGVRAIDIFVSDMQHTRRHARRVRRTWRRGRHATPEIRRSAAILLQFRPTRGTKGLIAVAMLCLFAFSHSL